MPKFVIEREIPNAAALPWRDVAGKSCGVIRDMASRVQWLESFVTKDKVYCIYIAPDEAALREHAQRGGFPANRISKIERIVDPTTSE